MLLTFRGIATQVGGETSAVVTAGISAALVTTQTGLMVALPGLFIAMVIRKKKHSIEANLARIESLILSKTTVTP